MKRKTNVLVVDDEKTVCSSCRKILTQEGYNVDVALTGREALNKIKGNGFDAVITDWKMPRMDGIELTRKIKEENPKIVVVLITGYPSIDNSIEAIRSGVSDLVTKPFTPEELSDAMLRALEKGQAVPAHLVADRLTEKRAVVPEAKPQVIETPKKEAVTRVPVEEKIGPMQFIGKSVLTPVFGRFFFILLGPLIIFTLAAGIFKAVLGKRPAN